MATATCAVDICDGNNNNALKWSGTVTFDPSTKNYTTADQFAADVKNGVFDIVASNMGVVPKGTPPTLTIPSVSSGGGSTAGFTLQAADIPASDCVTDAGQPVESSYKGYIISGKTPAQHVKWTTPAIAGGNWEVKATYKSLGGSATPTGAYGLNSASPVNLPAMQITEGGDVTLTFTIAAVAGVNTLDFTSVSGQYVAWKQLVFRKL